MTAIQCGNRKGHSHGGTEWHQSVLYVKECYGLITLCGWQYQDGYNEGEPIIRSCDGVVTETDRGWTCSNGHEYVTAEVRRAEGWDYASDEQEAKQLREHGTNAVAMNGGSI